MRSRPASSLGRLPGSLADTDLLSAVYFLIMSRKMGLPKLTRPLTFWRFDEKRAELLGRKARRLFEALHVPSCHINLPPISQPLPFFFMPQYSTAHLVVHSIYIHSIGNPEWTKSTVSVKCAVFRVNPCLQSDPDGPMCLYSRVCWQCVVGYRQRWRNLADFQL